MSWKQEYQKKLVNAEQAAQTIPSNSRLVLGHAASTPIDVLKAMTDSKERYENVEIVHMLCLGEGRYLDEDMKGHFRHNALFVGGNSRKAVSQNQADYTPCFFSMRFQACLKKEDCP